MVQENLSIKIGFHTKFYWCPFLMLYIGLFLNGDPWPTLCSFVLKLQWGGIIKLTLYFSRGQYIEWSLQQGGEAWPEPVSWLCYRAWQRGGGGTKTIERLLSCLQVLASSDRKRELFMAGVAGRAVLLRPDLLTQCHPPLTVHMAMPSLPLTSVWRVHSVACYWIDRSAGGRVCYHCLLWQVVNPCREIFLKKLRLHLRNNNSKRCSW